MRPLVSLCCLLFLIGFIPGADPDPMVEKLTVTPAAEPRPALSIQLLPPFKDQTTEDATAAYFRAFLDRPLGDAKTQQNESEEVHKWLSEMTPAELPRDKVKQYLESRKHQFKELERAARCGRCDWGTLSRLREDGIATLLQEAQPARELARTLSLRCKLEIAEERFKDAERSLQIGFQLARHVGEAPTLIQLLVGLAIQGIFLDRIEEWIATPGSPNLYWALTNLPRPLVDPRPGFAGEALWLEAMLPNLSRLRSGPIPHDEAGRIVEAIVQDLARLGGDIGADNELFIGMKGNLARLGFAGYVLWQYPGAKQEMINRGRPRAEVEKMAGAQVVFLNSLERFYEVRDNQWKWLGLPFHLAYPALKGEEQLLKQLRERYKNDLFYAVFTLVLPASEQVVVALARSQRRVDALRVIEAARIYAAKHGCWPASLDAPDLLPIPADIFTGKPFEYSTSGPTFVLAGPPPAGEPSTKRNSFRYEVTLKAK